MSRRKNVYTEVGEVSGGCARGVWEELEGGRRRLSGLVEMSTLSTGLITTTGSISLFIYK